MERKLVYNSVICLQCNETLVSTHVHDYKTCSCENGTMCDGGLQYGRAGGKDLSLVKPNYLYTDSPHEQIREVFSRGSRGEDGKQPLLYIKLKNIDNQYLDAIIAYEDNLRPHNPFLPIYRAEKEFRRINDKTVSND